MFRFVDANTSTKDETPVVMNRKVAVGTRKYSFKSCVIHIGPFKNSGHYVCAATCPDGSCVEFDDHKVWILPFLCGLCYLK